MNPEILAEIAKNPNFKDKQLLLELTELFATKPDAHAFLKLYGEYGEIVDDLVDEPWNLDNVRKADEYAIRINQCKYWIEHQQYLWVVRWLVHNTYFDTAEWETAEEEWKRRDAKALSHCGYMMLFAVILIEFGSDTLNKYSLRFRTHAHERHLQDPI